MATGPADATLRQRTNYDGGRQQTRVRRSQGSCSLWTRGDIFGIRALTTFCSQRASSPQGALASPASPPLEALSAAASASGPSLCPVVSANTTSVRWRYQRRHALRHDKHVLRLRWRHLETRRPCKEICIDQQNGPPVC